MELTNKFTVDVPVDEAWTVLTDVARIAPCMPGARLQEVDGDEYKGTVRVKVGPITAEYRGTATFVEQDSAAHRAVLRAEGRETRGQGNANATITATLEPADGATKVSISTDLAITGRVAQFGRGVLADVSNRLLEQFVESLESTVLSGSAPGAGAPGGDRAGGSEAESAGTPAAEGGATAGPREEPAAAVPVNLVKVAGPALAKRLAPLLAGVLALWALWWVRRRRCR